MLDWIAGSKITISLALCILALTGGATNHASTATTGLGASLHATVGQTIRHAETYVPAEADETTEHHDHATKTITTTEVIPFTTIKVNDPSLAPGQTVVRVQGVNGLQTLTYKVTYDDGRETSRVLVSTTMTRQPVTEVIAVGPIKKIICPLTITNTDVTAYRGCCPPYQTTDSTTMIACRPVPLND